MPIYRTASVWLKSPPLNSNEHFEDWASAQAAQSEGFNLALKWMPLP
jgi:hypothetical protein